MKKQLFNYDDSDIQSILDYSQKLLGNTLRDVIAEYEVSPYKTYRDYQENTISEIADKEISMKSKGQYGNYIEKYFYGYQPNSDSAADFEVPGSISARFIANRNFTELANFFHFDISP